jgi:hypothetical protein
MSDTHKFCSSCGVLSPLADFKRLLTRAQTKARGYVGTHRVEIDSKLCKHCQPKPKPLEKLSKKELLNKVASGDAHVFLVDSIIKERAATVNDRRSAKTSARWAEKQKKEWQKLVHNIGTEITMVRQQQKYAQNIKDFVRKEYATTYLDVMNRLRAQLRFAALKPHSAPHSVYWMEHLHQEEINKVRDVWEKLPLATRARMRLPLALGHRHTLPEESKPKMAFEFQQAEGVTPNERLANGIQIKLQPKDPPLAQSDNDWLANLDE